MSHDDIIRTVAVIAAAALLASPHARQIRDAATLAAEAARKHSGILTRVIGAVLLLAAAWGKLPLPVLPAATAVISVEEPTPELRRLVEPVKAALAAAPVRDRAIWAETWLKAGVVVAADNVHATPILPDVRSLRAFQLVALDVAWRRIGGIAAGRYPGLREATESVFASSLGLDDTTIDAAMRERYVATVRALAWAAR